MSKPTLPYEHVKRYILKCIADGVWKRGELTSSEHDLVRQFGVARMTVSRALDELARERILTRVKGIGTFVSVQIPETTRVEIRDIKSEILARGHRHRTEVLDIGASDDPDAHADLQLSSPGEGGRAFRSRVVHFENDVPLQVEDRHVDPILFPNYPDRDFKHETPGEYLARCMSLQHTGFQLSSRLPDDSVRRLLRMEVGEPCLTVRYQASAMGCTATVAMLWHPGSRFSLSG
jgi:GntR family transcriptional regulator, histidine utilization repressor